MNRQQRRLAKKNGLVPVQVGQEKVYHFTQAQLDSYIAKAVSEYTATIRKESSENAVARLAAIFLVAINRVAKYGKKRLDDILNEVSNISDEIDKNPEEMNKILERCNEIGYKFGVEEAE